MTLNIQALTMLHMLGAGLYLGAAYDTYSRLRIKNNRWLTLLQDFSFWLLQSFLVFLWLQWVNNGYMRIYIFLSLLCGYAMYRALIQSYYMQILERTISLVRAVYHLFVRLIRSLLIQPLIWSYQLILAVILLLVGFLSQLGLYVYRLIRYMIQQLIRLLLFISSCMRKKRSEGKRGFFTKLTNWLFRKKS